MLKSRTGYLANIHRIGINDSGLYTSRCDSWCLLTLHFVPTFSDTLVSCWLLFKRSVFPNCDCFYVNKVTTKRISTHLQLRIHSILNYHAPDYLTIFHRVLVVNSFILSSLYFNRKRFMTIPKLNDINLKKCYYMHIPSIMWTILDKLVTVIFPE